MAGRPTVWVLGCGALSLSLPLPAAAGEYPPPPLLLAQRFEGVAQLAEYWVSEKLDGVRGYWDGEKLLTRGGNRIRTPGWFTAGWPAEPLDGELWIGRGQFEATASIVRRMEPVDADWRRVHFVAFDLPASAAPFFARKLELERRLAALGIDWLRAVARFRVADEAALEDALRAVVASGGEGLMLQHEHSHYRAERSSGLLKLKHFEDAEAQVIAHLPGSGKYEGLLGSVEVRTPQGVVFRIGSGFSDELRRRPPPLGSWITYRHEGVTENGIPRFARFLRMRDEEPVPRERTPARL